MTDANDKQLWDGAAAEQQRVFSLGLNDYNAALLRFWREEGLLWPGCRVLDVGCGVGKYGTCLAALGCAVTLTDCSGEMLRRAEENMRGFQTPWAVVEADFDAVTGREPAFAGGFDLVLSTMSPAIHNGETVRKMSALSRGACFLARFQSWEEPVRDALLRRMGLEPRRRGESCAADAAAILRAVREAGHEVQTRTVEYRWSDPRSPEAMADYLCRRIFSGDGSLRGPALEAARELAGENGVVEDGVNTEVLWIWWKA